MFTTRRASRIGSLFVFLVLVACGGGGGGDGGSTTPTPTPPGVIAYASDYWQVANGSTWLYEGHDGTTSSEYRNTASLGAPMALGGRTLVRFQHTNMLNDGASPEYHSFSSADGIRTYMEIAPTDPDLSYVELPAEIRQQTYRAFEITEPVQGGTMKLTIDVTVVGFENVSLPAGQFNGALRTTQTFTATLTTPTDTGVGTSTIDYWYAKGIGVIKQVLTDPTMPTGSNAYTEQLAGVMTANVKAGVVGEYALLQNLGGGSNAVVSGRPGVASDGSGYLVVAHTTANYIGRLVATYVESDGTLRFADRVIVDNMGLTGPYTDYGPIHVAWDGARFWVVADGTDGGVIRQRVDPNGTVADGPGGTMLIADGSQPALAIEAGTVLVAYASYRADLSPGWSLYANAYTPDGTVVADRRFIAATGLYAAMPAVTAHAGEFMVTFNAGEQSDVMAMRFNMSGTTLDPVAMPVSTATGAQWSSEVAGWGGNTFVALWQDERPGPYQYNIVATRMSSTGSLLDGPAATGGVTMCGLAIERYGTAAADGVRGTLLGWTVGSYSSGSVQPAGIYGRLYPPGAELTTTAAPVVRYGLLTQQDYATKLMYPAAAAGPEGFLVAWVYNAESTGFMKSVRGVLVFPRYGS